MSGEIIKERMLRSLKKDIVKEWGCGGNGQEVLEKMYLQDMKGHCVPDDFIGVDDLLLEIQNKYYYFFGAIRDEFEPYIEIYISPSYTDDTSIVMILEDKLFYKDHIKPWNFWFESEEALTDEMYRIYCTLLAKSEKQWECYTLLLGDVEAVAERKGIDLEGIDMDDVMHYVKKGISWALDNRDEIIELAIHQSWESAWKLKKSSQLIGNCGQQ